MTVKMSAERGREKKRNGSIEIEPCLPSPDTSLNMTTKEEMENLAMSHARITKKGLTETVGIRNRGQLSDLKWKEYYRLHLDNH